MTLLQTVILSKLDEQQIFEFFHDCVTSLSVHNSNTVSKKTWNTQEFESLKNLAHQFFREIILDGSIPVPSELPQKAQNALMTVFNARKKDIINIVAANQLIANGHNLMRNFDWKLKWILGSSKLDGIKEPVCQVDLNCVKLGEDLIQTKYNIVNFECDLETLDELIAVLSKAKFELQNNKK